MLYPELMYRKLNHCVESCRDCANCPGLKCRMEWGRPMVDYIMRQAAEAIYLMHKKMSRITPAMAEIWAESYPFTRIPPDVLRKEIEHRLVRQVVETILSHPEIYTIDEILDHKENRRRYRFTILIMPPGGERDA